jgi:hypothetical protein
MFASNFGAYKFVWTSHFNWSHEWRGFHSSSTCSSISSKQGMFKSKNIVLENNIYVICKSIQGHFATTNYYLNFAPKPLVHMLHFLKFYFLYPRLIHTLHQLYCGFENKHNSIIDQLNCNFYPTSNIMTLITFLFTKFPIEKKLCPLAFASINVSKQVLNWLNK